jgi:hypothetical protein
MMRKLLLTICLLAISHGVTSAQANASTDEAALRAKIARFAATVVTADVT